MFSGKWLVTVGVITAIGIGLLQWSASAQDPSSTQRIDALEAGQKEILKELQEIKALLVQGRQAAPAPAQAAALPSLDKIELTINDSATRGPVDAKVVLVEFSDFECPFCARYTRDTKDQIHKEYVDTGKVRYVFKNFPLERLHPHAKRAAEAAECARRQNRFWEIHPRLFANQQALTDPDLRKHASEIGVGSPAFESCFAGQATSKVLADLAEGARAGISGTPTFFIGTPIAGSNRLKVEARLIGAQPFAAFKAALDKALGPT